MAEPCQIPISLWILLAAFFLDTLVGDPPWLPHPVVWMGKAISFFERVFRKGIKDQFVSGFFFALFLISATWALSILTIRLALVVHPLFGGLVQAILLFCCFSVKSLVRAALDVAMPLGKGDMDKARKKVAMIVGRETASLDESGVCRAAVETVAENFVDGFLSPLFFFVLLGVPGALTYKMVNTLDSMVGYTNKDYIHFGRAAARIDDGANYIPARLSVLVISFAAFLLSAQRGKQALETALSQGRNHKSPNAGFPEAAFAGALGVRMGGPNIYHGRRLEKPYIGGWFQDAGPTAVSRACELMQVSAFVAITSALALILFWAWVVP